MRKLKPSRKTIYLVCIGGLLLSVLLSLCLGSVWLSPRQLFAGDQSILRYSRLPRTLAALMAGLGLAVSGGVLQNVLNNKLASPSIIGINAGAGLGVTLCCAFGVLSGLGISLGAFLGSLTTVLLIWFFSRSTGASKSTVILGGVALNSILNAFSESVSVLDPEVAMLSVDFRVGGFSAVSYTRLLPATALILLTFLILLSLHNELDVVALGDDTARGLGLNAGKYRIVFLILCALLAGAAVSFAGLLGFVGLIVPHFVRKLVGSESRDLILLSGLIGAAFLTLSDTIARILFAPYELPVGILMAFIGGPVFVTMLVKSKRRAIE